jgi:hypothetical protein
MLKFLMELVERLRELEQLRKQGVITDSEYAALVANATEVANPVVLAPPTVPAADGALESEIATQPQKSGSGRKKVLIGTGVAVVLIAAIGVIASSGSSGNPLDSSEYKKLLAEKTELTKEIARTNTMKASALDAANTAEADLAKIQEQVDSYQLRVDYETAMLRDLETIKP